MSEENLRLRELIVAQEQRIGELERGSNPFSGACGMPPSSDGFAKPPRRRGGGGVAPHSKLHRACEINRHIRALPDSSPRPRSSVMGKSISIRIAKAPPSLEIHPQADACSVACRIHSAEPGIEALEAEDEIVFQPVVDSEIDPASGPQALFRVLGVGERAAGRL